MSSLAQRNERNSGQDIQQCKKIRYNLTCSLKPVAFGVGEGVGEEQEA